MTKANKMMNSHLTSLEAYVFLIKLTDVHPLGVNQTQQQLTSTLLPQMCFAFNSKKRGKSNSFQHLQIYAFQILTLEMNS